MLTLLTWNLNVGMAGDTGTAELIRGFDADLVLLQEVGPEWQEQLQRELSEDYEVMLFTGQEVMGGAGGLALLSRLPAQDALVLDSPIGWFPSQRVTVDTPEGPIEVLNVHLVPPFTDGGRLLLGWLTRHGDRKREAEVAVGDRPPDLMAGDFNANERDRALRWLRREHDLHSALPEFQPRAKTWRMPHLPPWRLDHVLVGPAWEATDAQVHQVGPSDHWPVTVTLRRTP